ncbi:MAG: CoA transferase [Anaerolineaceae bacterium]|nr:CoA transferase [Anaerolineaceae bacterium]
MTPPLSGIRVLDLTRLLPGSVCSLLLADMGADIIKIEDPNGGDYARWMPPTIDGLGSFFRVSNRNKRSAIIDLKDAQGRAVFQRLVAGADVVIESFRPGVMTKLGCDAAALRAINPRLVYCSLSGWGADGPYAQYSGHDLNYLAVSGLLGAMRKPAVPGGQVADVGGALAAVAGILAALVGREQTGEGRTVDVGLFEAALLFSLQPWIETMTAQAGDAIPSDGTLTGGQACYNVYTARDGRTVTLGAIEPKFWERFCQAVARPDLIPDYLAPARQAYLHVELAELFALRSAAEWEALLAPVDCCFAVVNTPAEVVDNVQVVGRGMLGIHEDGTPWIHSPVHLSDAPLQPGGVPGYGEHTRAVLGEAGYSAADIDVLIAAGAVKTAE